jgi:hypothetical protein
MAKEVKELIKLWNKIKREALKGYTEAYFKGKRYQ